MTEARPAPFRVPGPRELADLLDLLEARDRTGAVAYATALSARAGVEHLVTQVLGPAQAEVGARWQTGRWTVSQEHAASAIVQAVLEALGDVAGAARTRGRVVLACVEDEWHSLPARMFTELLRARGWDVDFLGASIAPDDLPDFLTDVQPDALALSCSVAMNLPGAARVIDAAHSVAVPVLIGGRGVTRARAVALGADGYATDARGASALLQSWQHGLVLAAPRRPGAREAAMLALHTARIVDAVMAELPRSLPMTAGFTDRQTARTRADYVYILRFLAAAVLVDDLAVYTEFLTWLQGILVGVGLPAALLPLSLDALTPLLAAFPAGAAMNRQGALALA